MANNFQNLTNEINLQVFKAEHMEPNLIAPKCPCPNAA
jgi:hypothetical protein